MGMTMSGLNPNGFPQPQSIAPAPAMGIMAMMAAAAPQPAALSMGAAAQALPVVDTVPAGNSSLESGGGGGSGHARRARGAPVSGHAAPHVPRSRCSIHTPTHPCHIL